MRKKRRLPPPAATVLMSSCGDRIETPAVRVSSTCSYVPAYRETSVDVPPMSKPITAALSSLSTRRVVSA